MCLDMHIHLNYMRNYVISVCVCLCEYIQTFIHVNICVQCITNGFYLSVITNTVPITRSGNVGSGICLFSKFPIVDAQALPFHVVQGIFAVLRFKLELLTGKGCLSCRLKTPLGYVKIYILHVSETGTSLTYVFRSNKGSLS